MKVITFAIQKGGTGKTSTAYSTAVELAEKGKKVLVVDADPQGNATTWSGIEEINKELSDVLLKLCDVNEAITKTSVENLDFLPTASVGGSLKIYSKKNAIGAPFAIRHLLKPIRDKYDYCIIDTSPAFGALEESCFLESDEVIPVLKMDEFSKDGLETFIYSLNDLKENYDSDKPKITKLILNERDLRLPQQENYLSMLKASAEQFNLKIYIIPVDQSFKKGQEVHVPIQYLSSTKKETLTTINNIASDLMEVSND